MSPLGTMLWRLNTGTVRPIFLNSKKHYSEQRSSVYDSRKYGHCLPQNNIRLCFEAVPGAPTGVFRTTDGEVLGRGAAKCAWYQNPEYFSFHHMTFYDMHLYLRPRRKACPETGRKP